MSKAKELAREVISQMEEIQRQVMNNNILSGFTNDWQSGFNHAMIELRNRLNDAVLSEPDEPEGLKGWIEVTGRDGARKLINLALVERVDIDRSGVYFEFNRDDCVAYVKESYDSIKQKIREAS